MHKTDLSGTGGRRTFGRPPLVRETPPVNEGYAGYTFGYNRPLLANRVHDILTAVAMAKGHEKTKAVELVGWEKAGPWVLLARGLCGSAVERTAADLNRFRFDKVRQVTDEMMLPGALKYGGLPALTALSAPHELFLHNTEGTGVERWVSDAYSAARGSENMRIEAAASPDKMIGWLLR